MQYKALIPTATTSKLSFRFSSNPKSCSYSRLEMANSQLSLSCRNAVETMVGVLCGRIADDPRPKIRGRVVLMKKSLIDVTDAPGAFFYNRYYKILRRGVCLRFISSTHGDPNNDNKGMQSEEAYLQNWTPKFTSLAPDSEATFDITVEWDAESMGIPGAFIIKNLHHEQIYLKSVTLDNVPVQGHLHFVCNSWIYPAHRYNYDRIFFSNRTYLPDDTPEPLRWYRNEELLILRGKGASVVPMVWDRVYDYAFYNDLGYPELGEDYVRPVLGGSEAYPYPRRQKTGRRPNKSDPRTESRLFFANIDIYVPRDERFSPIKFSDFIADAVKSLGQIISPEIKAAFDKTPNEFDTFQDLYDLYDTGIYIPEVDTFRRYLPCEFLRELFRSDDHDFLTYPLPDVIQQDRTAWRRDEEFCREMLAGVNPTVIRRLTEFPPQSKLGQVLFGDQGSKIRSSHIEKHMNGLTVGEAMAARKMYILDHHDSLVPYITRINTTATKTYASRTFLLLQDDGTLKPLAIELSKPHPTGNQYGSFGDVYTPSDEGVSGAIWQLAKAYVAVNDSGYHQLVSHWLNTHAVMEPFIIATNRRLSVMHPIYKLMKPHLRDTMHINALARQILLNAGGLLESTVFPGKYGMELSSLNYKKWNFNEQALPTDLENRGIVVADETQRFGYRFLIEDYPYAVDGMEIWEAIESWVLAYCNVYYSTGEKIKGDSELQSWWREAREDGHGDKRNERWWPKLENLAELVRVCTTMIWIASALHAAVNFGQYPYAGYMPNRPAISRRFMPTPGSPEYEELERNPDGVFLKTITSKLQTMVGISVIELLSRHSTDEIYLGQRESPEWTDDRQALEAFEKFRRKLVGIEKRIEARNRDPVLKNRTGPVNMSYTLLHPNTSDASRSGGLAGKGIPNSISI